jgi:pentatricopeptide repeat protein
MTLAWGPTKPTMGSNKDICNGIRHNVIEHFAWNQKLTKYVKDGQPEKAMQLFQQMQRKGVCFNKFTFVQVIKVCVGLGTFEDGKLVHKELIQIGCKFVGSSLVDIYAKCGSIEDA